MAKFLNKNNKWLGASVLIIFIGIILYINLEVGKSANAHINYKPPTISRPHGGVIAKEPAALPNEWMGYQRTYPHGKINHQNYIQAIRQAEIQHKNSVRRNREWELLGPTNIGGRITDLIIDSDNPGTIYIGAASGGIYKTINNGISWQQIFHQVPVVSIGDLAIDPQNHQVLYAGTGEANASSYSFLGDGIWKSVNGGIDWAHSGLEESAYIARIIVDHSNSNRIFAAACGTLFSSNSQRGVYRSLDGGNLWERVLFLTDSTADSSRSIG